MPLLIGDVIDDIAKVKATSPKEVERAVQDNFERLMEGESARAALRTKTSEMVSG